MLGVAEARQAEPHEPRRVDPRGPAPVAPDPQEAVLAGREDGSVGGDRGGRHRQPEPRGRRAGAPPPAGGRCPRAGPAAPAARARPRSAPASAFGCGTDERLEQRPSAWLYIRSTIVGVSDGRPQRQQRQSVEDVRRHLAAHRTAGGDDPPQVVAEPAVAPHEQDEPAPVWARRPQTASNCGEASRPDSSGWTIQISPSPSRSRWRAQPVVVAHDPRHGAGSPTAMRQAQASSGGWMLAVIGASGEVTL